MRKFQPIIIALTAICFGGCSGRPARVQVAEIDYEAAAQKAVASYDQDANGLIEAVEAARDPAFQAAFPSIDADANASATPDEVAEYLRKMQAKRVAMVRWTLRLQLDGKPLTGAKVTFEPAEFLLPGVLPAEGVSDERGIVTLSVPEEHRPTPNARVVYCGLYNVHISKVEGGREKLPKKYATGSTLGVEVGPEGQTNFGLADIRLSSSG